MRAEEAFAGAPESGAPLREDISRAAGGDAAAFRGLFERYHDRLFRYAFARLGRSEDANDVVQEIFLSVWRALPTFEYHHEGSFPAWLFRIASRRVGDRVRVRRRHDALPLDEAPEGRVEFEGLAVSRRLLTESLAKLPDRQREVVLLRFVADLPVRDIAVSMGRTEAAVTALQMRGLQHLRRYIGREHDE
jgi:RNA polymerase sigma-70 factor (ECF subfamily)